MSYKNRTKRGLSMIAKVSLLTAALLGLAVVNFVSNVPFVSSVSNAAGNLGNGRVTNVVGVDGSCVSGPDGDSVQSWEVAQGGTYEVTLSNVTDCANGGTDASIGVIVKSSDNGNQCLTATKQSTGVYKFTVTMPAEACNTFPIEYCVTNCDASTGLFARRDDGGNFQVHLRAATFGEGCSFTGLDTDCDGGGGLKAAISACKFYDFNANGQLDVGEIPLDGWPMTLSPLDGAIPQTATQLTVDGCVSWSNLDPAFNPYSVTEGTPNELNWFHSTPNPVSPINVVANQESDVLFGNYCTVPSGGLTLGFWSNKNGQAILSAHDPDWRNQLNALCLRNADGTDFTVPGGSFNTAYTAFRNWLLAANATNMAYMLSAQLAAMKLNILYGGVNPASFDLCSSKTIGQLVTDANQFLCDDGITLAGDPNRAPQEAAKNCLDSLNNGAPVVPPTPCARTFPAPAAPTQ